MKQPLIASLALSLLLPVNTFAADVLSGELQEDLFFPDGVKILGVAQPDQDTEVGISSVYIDGYGSMVIGSRATGDFPRMALIGGTTVMSKRDWTDYHRKTWWNGVIQSPQPKKHISLRDIPELHPVLDRGIKLEVIGTYQWGLDNESFDYSQAARVALPAPAIDGEKAFMVFQQDDDNWKIDRTRLCSVQNELCVFDVTSVKAVTLVKRLREVAQAGTDDGFWDSLFNDNANSDNPDAFFEDLFQGTESTNGSSAQLNNEPPSSAPSVENTEPQQVPEEQGVDYKQYYESATYQETPVEEQRHYYLKKYGTNSGDRADMRPEEGLEGEDLEKVRAINVGKLSRRLRKAPEPSRVVDDNSNSRFLDYLLAMRNKFGEGAQQNVFGVELESAPEEAFDGAMMLPSTGPGLFVAMAIMGFVLMVFGALRRD